MRVSATLTADEATGVHKDTAIDTRQLGELIVTNATPFLRQGFATLEALGRDRDRLNAPVTSRLVGVKNVQRLLGLRDLKCTLQLEQMFLWKQFSGISGMDCWRCC